MQAFTVVSSKALPLNRANVDTDAIIPKQYLKSIFKTGFGAYLFDDWRYLDAGDLGIDVATRRVNPEFVLNNPAYQGAQILLARENFGCGSSREHAVWALDNYGFRCVIAPSYADIFFSNCFKNGFLPVALPAETVEQIFAAVQADANVEVTVNLKTQTVQWANQSVHFEIDEFRKECLLQGLDEIGITLKSSAAIKEFEAQYQQKAPWIFT